MTDARVDHCHPPRAAKKYGYRIRNIHGAHFDDPWDWLRDKHDPEVIAHLNAENAWADTICAPQRDLAEAITQEIRSHTALTDVTVPVRDGDYWWFSRWAEGQQYRTHHRIAAHNNHLPIPKPGVAWRGEELVLDENQHAVGHTYFQLGDLVPSPCGRLVAWSRDTSGDERWTWTVQEAATGTVIDEAVHDTGVGLAWAADSSAFIYTRLDEAWRQHEVWLHRVGTSADEDLLLLREDDERFEVWFSPSADPHHVAIHAVSPTTGEAWLWRTATPEQVPLPLTGRQASVMVTVEPAGDHLLLIHTRDSVEGTLCAAPLPAVTVTTASEPLAPPSTWVPIRHASDGERLTEVEAYRDFCVLSLRSGSLTQVEHRLRTEKPADSTDALDLTTLWGPGVFVEVPSSVRTISTAPAGRFVDRHFRITYHSVTVPPTWENVDPRTGTRTRLKTLEVPLWDPNDYVEERVWVQARDGHTQIPVTLVHRRDAQPDGTHAAWLHGYGAYEIPFDAEFSALRLPALRRGVVHAIAHIRGGGEMGRAWYEDGKELRKVNTFTDFLDVAQWLETSGWVQPGRLIAEGRSAGGLLMGAVVNMDPTRFGAVLAGVPFVDALTTILDASLPLTAGEWEEWGNPITDATIYRAMRAYTPYENVRDGVAYPAMMVTTSLNDTRVFHVEPAKWVQRLREATTSDTHRCPIVLRTEMVAGHGGPSGREGHWRARAEEFAFALSRVDATIRLDA
ncbi:S9 family peptidase [Schaalia suimastitidis]|uniref:S9 family peptidase n=1 Tax=Schaalia suimastitidis TaxID=121163 RepID=UPI00040DDF40|nr:prolyl oligopeptidase family serine peptidase [Schaalia suimastitidis]